MRLRIVLSLLICPAVYCQNLPQPLTQVEACRQFRASIVQVDSDTMHGTGFVVAPDGWIVTALHVVVDPQTLIKREHILVSTLGRSRPSDAEVVSPIDKFTMARDFAILKINKTNLPTLDLGNEISVEDGSPVVIIGLPLSATFRPQLNSIPRFCLSGTVAAQSALPLGNMEFLHAIYFQGVSIKGISGAPIISLVNGKVIGLVSTRLTGITQGLDQARTSYTISQSGLHADVNLSGFDVGKTVIGLVDTLDNQLANGLGSGTGAADAAIALEKAKREYKRQHPK